MEKHIFVYGRNGYAKKTIKALSKAKIVQERDKVLLPFTEEPVAIAMVKIVEGKGVNFFRPGLGKSLCVFRAEQNYTAMPEFKTKAKAYKEACSIAAEIKASCNARISARTELVQRLTKITADRTVVASEVELAALAMDDVTHRSKMNQLAFIDMEIAFITKSLKS